MFGGPSLTGQSSSGALLAVVWSSDAGRNHYLVNFSREGLLLHRPYCDDVIACLLRLWYDLLHITGRLPI